MIAAAALPQEELTPELAAQKILSRRAARTNLLDFAIYTKPDYEANEHHVYLCEYLDKFVKGEIKRLLVSMPPRSGKSELVSRRLPAYIFGVNPDAHIISCSYSADLSSRMNRDVQRIIDSPRYKYLFPDTSLNASNVRTDAQGSYLRNSDVFEIVGHNGMYRSAGVGGGITGLGADFGLIDDPVKNQEEAMSQTYREKAWEWYTSTFYTRLEKDGRLQSAEGVAVTVTTIYANNDGDVKRASVDESWSTIVAGDGTGVNNGADPAYPKIYFGPNCSTTTNQFHNIYRALIWAGR